MFTIKLFGKKSNVGTEMTCARGFYSALLRIEAKAD